ncbi:hypothetical protein [Bacillus velezensis]|nr:hypothetical protein [Bacillus velezensis]
MFISQKKYDALVSEIEDLKRAINYLIAEAEVEKEKPSEEKPSVYLG